MTRLLSLGLDTYGIFDGKTLPLGKALTVVVGANEAGKSTALNALADLLWGLPTRHWLAEVTPRATARVSAELEDLDAKGGPEDGSTFTVIRTGRGLHTGGVLHPAENPWGTDGDDRRTRWLTAFGLSHTALREGGRQVCAGGGDLAELVFTAQHGLGVQNLLREIEQRADNLYKEHRGNKNVRLRLALEEYQGHSQALDEAMVRASQVIEAEAAVDDLKSRTAQAAEREKQASRGVARLAEHTRCLDTVRAIREVRREIAGIKAEGVVVHGDDLNDYDQTRSALQDADREHSQTGEQMRRWTADRDVLTVDHAVLADADVIDDLRAQAEARGGDRDHAEARQLEAGDHDRRARADIEALLGQQGTAETGLILDALTIPADLATQLDALAGQHASLIAERKKHVERVEQEHSDFSALVQGPGLPDRDALAPLMAAVGALTAAESPLVRLRAARVEQIEGRRRCRQAMLEAGAADPESEPPTPPGEEDTASAVRRVDDARGAADRAQERLREAESTIEEHHREQQAIENGRTVHPGMLAEARTGRDELWSSITRAWVDGITPPDSTPRVLAATFSELVQAADALADQLIDQAQVDARLAETQRNLESAARDLEQRQVLHENAARALDTELAAWKVRWSDIGVAVPTTARAQAVRQALLTAAGAAVDVKTARETVGSLEPELAEWSIRLNGLLKELSPTVVCQAQSDDDTVADSSTVLEHLLAAAQTLMAEVDRAREHQERRRAAQQALERSKARLAGSEQALSEWVVQWRTLVDATGLPATIDPAGWAERRRRVDAARTAHQAAVTLCQEATTARRAWESFRSAVSDLGTRHGLVGSPERVLAELWQRLSASRADQRTHQERTTDIDNAAMRLTELTGIQTKARSRLDELCRRWSVSTLEDLTHAAERGHRLAEYRAGEGALMDTLRAAIDVGHDPEDILTVLADTDRADLEVRADQAEQDRVQAQQAREDLSQELGAARQTLTDLQRRGDAADLNARTQEELAAVADLAEEYAALHLQRLILREALEADAARHASPILRTAGRLLERLTGGRWVALQAEDDGAGIRMLRVVRHDGEPQHRAALSEGTADQVFLALRLAGITHLQNERLRAGQASLPVVLDDVLMAFDDERATNALRTLSDVAAGTVDHRSPMQVILFTHHEHLATLAGTLGRDDLRIVHLDERPLPDDRVDPEMLRDSAARAGAALAAASRAPSSTHASAVSSPRRATSASSGPTYQVDPSQVRAWAREHGIDVADRGRLPADLVSRYQAAQQR